MSGLTTRKKILAVLFLAVASAPARGADPPDSQVFVYDDGAGHTMSYRLFPPPDIDPAREYPLVLYLHGMGFPAVDELALLTSFIGGLMAATQSDDCKSYLVVPQSSPTPETGWWEDQPLALLAGVLGEVESRYPIDERRLYVTGHSMGAGGTLMLHFYYPDPFPHRFAAGVPISCNVSEPNWELAAAVLKDFPLWIFHGALDEINPVSNARGLVQAIRDAGGDIHYTEYPNESHADGLPEIVYDDPNHELYPWLFGQKLVRGPQAIFSALPESGEAPLEVCFDAGASTVGDDATTLRFDWDFGDGASAEGAAPCHTYEQAGRYRVQLRVTNDLNVPDLTTGTVTAFCPGGDVSPWSAEDIGEPTFPGGAQLLDGGRGMALCGGGRILSGINEKLQFVHREVSGDAALTLRIASLEGPSGGAQVGIMFRESLAPDACCAAVTFLTGSTGSVASFHSRDVPNGLVRPRGKSLGVAGAPDLRLRIARRGGEHIGFASADGTAWEELGRWPIPEGFPGTFHAGVFAGEAYPIGDESIVAVRAEVGEVTLADCREGGGAPGVTRSIAADFCASPPVIAVTLKARNIGAGAMIVESLPAPYGGDSPCAAVVDAGGGMVADGMIRFALVADGDVTYRLDPTGCCPLGGRLEFRGEATGGSGCSSAVSGESSAAPCCPCEGDTRCTGLRIEEPAGGGPGTYRAIASAEDASGDPVIYFFQAEDGLGRVLTAGPQAESAAEFELAEGTWIVTVVVDDDPSCGDASGTAACRSEVAVGAPGGLIVPGDANGDGSLDLSDAVATLGFLFLGSPARLPCGDGTAADPANLKLADVNGDGAIDLSDPVSILSFLFLGSKPPALGTECVRIVGCPENTICGH